MFKSTCVSLCPIWDGKSQRVKVGLLNLSSLLSFSLSMPTALSSVKLTLWVDHSVKIKVDESPVAFLWWSFDRPVWPVGCSQFVLAENVGNRIPLAQVDKHLRNLINVVSSYCWVVVISPLGNWRKSPLDRSVFEGQKCRSFSHSKTRKNP